MLFSDVTAWLSSLLPSLPNPPASARPPAAPTGAHPFRIAVVGAGIAGSRAAHRLAALTTPDFPVRITVFEASDHVGGRVRSVAAPGGLPDSPPAADPPLLEAGAPYFFDDDWCLAAAVQAAGVTTSGNASAVPAVWSSEWSRFRTDDVCHRSPAPPGLRARLRRAVENAPFTAGLGLTYGVAPWFLGSAAAAETAKCEWKLGFLASALCLPHKGTLPGPVRTPRWPL